MRPSWGEILRHNIWQALIHFDQGLGLIVSTLLKEKAYSDLTLSANAYRWEYDGVRSWPRRWIDRLFFWQPHHCYSAYLYEVECGHLPECMR